MDNLAEHLEKYRQEILMLQKEWKEAGWMSESPAGHYELGRLDGQLELIRIMKRERPDARDC